MECKGDKGLSEPERRRRVMARNILSTHGILKQSIFVFLSSCFGRLFTVGESPRCLQISPCISGFSKALLIGAEQLLFLMLYVERTHTHRFYSKCTIHLQYVCVHKLVANRDYCGAASFFTCPRGCM